MEQYLTEIKESLDDISRWPWFWIGDACLFPKGGQDAGDAILYIDKMFGIEPADARFISKAPEYVTYLYKARNDLYVENERLKKSLQEARERCAGRGVKTTMLNSQNRKMRNLLRDIRSERVGDKFSSKIDRVLGDT